ncbi:hypothetical protein V8E54_009872 [Elaphomyces granulatus]
MSVPRLSPLTKAPEGQPNLNFYADWEAHLGGGLNQAQSELQGELPFLKVGENSRIGNEKGLKKLEEMDRLTGIVESVEEMTRRLLQTVRGEAAQTERRLRAEAAQTERSLRAEAAQMERRLRAEAAQMRGEVAQTGRRLRAEAAQMERRLREVREEVDRLLPYFGLNNAIRRGLLEAQSEYALAKKFVQDRNAVAHGGDVRSDAEVIGQIENTYPERVGNWKWSFHDIYGMSYESTCPVLPTAPMEIIRTFNIHGDTKLHRNQPNKTKIPDDVRQKLMDESQTIINEWITSQTLNDNLKARCDNLAEEYNLCWIW